MTDPVRKGLVVLQHALNERRRLQKKGKIPPDKGFSLTPASLGFNKSTSRPEILAALPRLCTAYNLSENDLTDVINTLRLNAKRKEEHRARVHKAAAEKAKADRLPENWLPRRFMTRFAYPNNLKSCEAEYNLAAFQSVRNLTIAGKLNHVLGDEDSKAAFLAWCNAVIDAKRN